MEGGGNRFSLRPHIADDGEILGTHRGNSEAMNIKNPQPGWHYYHPRRDASAVQRKLNEGWRPITSTDPEKWGVDHHADIPEMDGLQAFKDVIAMKIPEAKYRVMMAEKARLARLHLESPTEEYLEKGMQLTAQTHSEDELYFKGRQHRLTDRED